MLLRVKVTGVTEVEKEFKRIDDAVMEAKTLEIAARAGGVLWMMEVHRTTPVETGRLYRSLRFQTAPDPERVVIELGPEPGYDEFERGRLQDPQRYDPIIEAIGTPAGRAQAYKEKARQKVLPQIRQTILAILKAAVEGRQNQFLDIGRTPGGGTF